MLLDGAKTPETVVLRRRWHGGSCESALVNQGAASVRVREVILCSVPVHLAPETPFYAEGSQMLSQSGGTFGHPNDLGAYTDRGHYRLAEPPGARSVYGMALFSPANAPHCLFAFTSCRRFVGRFDIRERTVDAVLDLEGRELAPGETWPLEEFQFTSGPDRAELLARLAARICRNHPPQRLPPIPTGWCSWYCFGAGVTARQTLDNLEVIAARLPGLRYIQIDDGYQHAMGDWLETGAAFGGEIRKVLQAIRDRGFVPAIWVAPFIAEESSHLFQTHPDWFVQDEQERPLRSDKVTFGGWRHGPWYALDGSHPAVQHHLEEVFRVLNREWGCSYFKLDASFWGMLPGGRLHDPKATRVEAYRRGTEAILRGAGKSFILGCNHPIWPSFGLLHGSRSSGDIARRENVFFKTARENLSRNWQNGRLWYNDPDCLLLTGNLPESTFLFHATALYATGGMLLSGDDLTTISPEREALLRKLLPPTGRAARFEDHSLRIGRVDYPNRQMLCLFNWEETPRPLTVRLPAPCEISDFWSGTVLGRFEGLFSLPAMPGHSARLLTCAR